MTRGQIAIVTPEDRILTSTEFNGDMYFEGHGRDVYNDLECVETVEEYKEFVTRFNEKNFKYEKELFYECDDTFFDLHDDYSGKWFSDYVYIKNLSKKLVVFTDAKNRKIVLDTETTAVFYFGEFVACCSEDFEARAFIDELNEKKENLSNDAERNYDDIWNMCADYDNDHRGSYLTDRINEHDFVTEDILECIVIESATDISRLRCFLGDTYDANIYRLDGYGNLVNVEQDDFESLIDDIVLELEQNIAVPYAKQEVCL